MTLIVLHLAAFFVVALACHLELAASRPPTETLTEFYLWLSAGGAVGGLFNALIAPVLFVNPFEYPLAALSACLLLPNALSAAHSTPRSTFRTAVAVAMTAAPAILVALLVMFVQRYDAQLPTDTFPRYAIIFIPPCLAAFTMRRAPLRMGIALAAIVVAGAFVRFDNRVPIHLERSFFGVHRVLFSGRERVLLSGTTNHGAQSINPSLRCEPLTITRAAARSGSCSHRLRGPHEDAVRRGRAGHRVDGCLRSAWPGLDVLRDQSGRRTHRAGP